MLVLDEHKLILLRGAVKYVWIFVAILMSGLLLQIGVGLYLPTLVNFFQVLDIQISEGIAISGIGFGIPLIISLCLIFYIAKTKKSQVSGMGWLSIILSLVLIVLSKFIPLVNITEGGAAGCVPLVILFNVYLFYQISKNNYEFALPLSYILGFLAGAMSDFIATFGVISLKTGIWGGWGLVDADFFLPIVFLLTVSLMKKFNYGQATHHKLT